LDLRLDHQVRQMGYLWVLCFPLTQWPY